VLTLRSRADCRCCRPSLKFYKHVYEARQDRRDLEFAGNVTHPRGTQWPEPSLVGVARKLIAAEFGPEFGSLPAPPSPRSDDAPPSNPPSGPSAA